MRDADKVCWYCSGSHLLKGCSQLREQPWNERIEFMKKKRLCFGCLKMGHMKGTCNMKATCEVCKGQHLPLLHMNRNDTARPAHPERNVKVSSVDPGAKCLEYSNVACDNENDSQCTMAIVPVRVRLVHGLNYIVTYTFLDPGSSVSFCSEALTKKLCGVGRRMHIRLDTMGDPHSMDTYLIEGLQVQCLDGTGKVKIPRVYTKDKLPVKRHHIPTHDNVSHWKHLKDVHMPQINAGIDLLIGNNVPDAYSPLEVRTGPPCDKDGTWIGCMERCEVISEISTVLCKFRGCCCEKVWSEKA